MTISQPGDELEREAERVAEQVMRMPNPAQVQRKCTTCEEDESMLRRKPYAGRQPHQGAEVDGDASMDIAPSAVYAARESSSGHALDRATRAFFEPRFGADFSQVRLHTDEQAAQAAAAVSARAYTLGSHIYFASGEYRPTSSEGRQLLAHELTHVVQQSLGSRQSTAQVTHSVAGSRQIQRQLITPLAPGGGFRGLMERDQRRVAEPPARPSPSNESCDIQLCFLPLALLLDMGVRPELAYFTANHVFLRFDGRSVGFTRLPGEGIHDARVITPEPRATPRSPYERCVTARLRTIPTPTLGQVTSFGLLDSVGDLISYGMDVVHGTRHCPTPSCALARYRIARMLVDDRRGLYDLFDENCETWARKVLAAGCLQAPEVRLGGVLNIGGMIINETTLGRLYHASRLISGRTRPLPPPAPAPTPPTPTTAPAPLPAPTPTPTTAPAPPTPASPLAPPTIRFTLANNRVRTNSMGKAEDPIHGFRFFRVAAPLFDWTSDITIHGNPGDPCSQWEVGPHQVAISFWRNIYWGSGANQTHRRYFIRGGLPMRDATAAANTWYHDALAQRFGACGDTRNTGLNDTPASAWHPWNNPKPGRIGNAGTFNYGFAFVAYLSARDTTKGTGARAFRALAHLYWNFGIAGTFDASKPLGSRVTITSGGSVNRSRIYSGGSRRDPSMHGGSIVNDNFDYTET